MKKKIYCFNNGGRNRFLHAVAIGEDGTVLAEHCCSHEGFMGHDLGMDGSTWKHEHYNKHYGEGNWELEWVNSDQIETHKGLNIAFALNKENNPPTNPDAMPSVEIEFK